MVTRASSSQSTETQSIERDKCWSWSIQPLVTWIRILGVNLPGSCSTSYQLLTSNRRLAILYEVFCLVVNIFGQFEILRYIHLKRMEEKQFVIAGEISFSTTTANWNFIFNFWNCTIYGAGIHLIFLLVIRPRLSGLIQIFQRCHLAYDNECYYRIRRISFFSITYIIISVRMISKCIKDINHSIN